MARQRSADKAMVVDHKIVLLKDAIAVMQRRSKSHGDSKGRQDRLGEIWASMISTRNGGVPIKINGELISLLMCAMKLHRACYGENEDNYLDAAAYAALAYDSFKKGKEKK